VALLRRFAADEAGATAIEYGLIAALIAVAIIAALRALSGNIQNTFNYVGTQLAGATTN
jgi:pilus assembly protein Flp/PilA